MCQAHCMTDSAKRPARDRGAAHVKAWTVWKAQQDRKASARKGASRPPAIRTHEWYLGALTAALAKSPDLTAADRKAIASARVTYGWGERGTRGIAVKGYWQGAKGDRGHLVGINCGWQRSVLELVETLAHELGHVIDNLENGHGAGWRRCCERLGFPGARAVDTQGDGALSWEWFTPAMAKRLKAVPLPNDGSPLDPSKRPLDPATGKPTPVWSTDGPSAIPDKPRPCGAGWGRSGGKSRGKGAGSRYLKWTCGGGCIVRHAGTELDATCNKHGGPFTLSDASLPPAHVNGGAVGVHGGHRKPGCSSKPARVPAAQDVGARVNAPLPLPPGPLPDIPF